MISLPHSNTLHMIRRILRNLGVEIRKFKPTPYENFRGTRRYEERQVNLRGAPFRIADTASFYASYREIFIEEIYDFSCSTDTPMILDCGSNYGTSIVYFKERFPKARVVGVEADPKIFSILSDNIKLRSYSDVTLINKAISVGTRTVQFTSEGADSGRIHTNNSSNIKHDVAVLELDELITGDVDFLKMDIEGEEVKVLESSRKLHMVQNIFVEYHSFADSEQKLDMLLSVLSNEGFRYYVQSQFCSPKPLVRQDLQIGMDLQLNIFAKRSSS